MFLRYASFWGRKFILPRKCRENAAKMPQKKSASADLSVIIIYCLFLFVRQKEQAYLVMHFIRPLLFCINPDLFLSADMFVRACWESRGRTWLRNLVPRPA